jgi:uncharacterized membrane protein
VQKLASWFKEIKKWKHCFKTMAQKLFFTRWIFNICAPGFALLMGMSIIFYSEKKQQESSKNSKVFFFIKRVFILIILQQLLDLPTLIFNFNTIDKIPLNRGGVL